MEVNKSLCDEEIVAALVGVNKNQQDIALGFLYRTNFPKVMNFIINNSGSEEQAKDVFQDAIVIFYKKIRTKEFQGLSTISTFLYGIAKNLWLQTLVKNQRYTAITEDFVVEPNESLEDQDYIEISNSSVLETLMGQIGERCKSLLITYYYENQSTEAIRKKLGMGSEQAVRNKIYRCMQVLRGICSQNKITRNTFNSDEK